MIMLLIQLSSRALIFLSAFESLDLDMASKRDFKYRHV